jgi:type II secretory pathway predicted ATPase ExeA
MDPQESATLGHLGAIRQRDFAAFRLTPDLRFVFPQAAHEAAFAALLDALRRDEGILLATGDVGVGKTMLARRLERELRRSGTRVAYLAYPDLSISELLRCLYVAFDLSPPSGRAALDVAEAARLIATAPAGRQAILLDDADKCSTALLSELERLIRDADGAGRTLQAVLFGTPDLPARLSAEIPHVAVAAATRPQLAPLSLEETGTYIRHRLGVLGARQDVFSTDAIEAIASYARGVPRLVNQACGRALLLAGPDRDGAISQAMILEAIDDCPAIALADPRVAAWATSTPAEGWIESDPVAAVAETAVRSRTEAAPPVVALEPLSEPLAAADPVDLDPASEPPLQVPEPPSARKAERASDPPQTNRHRKRRARPAPDRLQWSSPADRDDAPMTPSGAAPRFAGFVPRAGRSRPVPAVESVGPIDTALRRPAASGWTGRRLLPIACGAALAVAVSAGAYSIVDPDFARAARDKLRNAAAASTQEIHDAATALTDFILKLAGQS